MNLIRALLRKLAGIDVVERHTALHELDPHLLRDVGFESRDALAAALDTSAQRRGSIRDLSARSLTDVGFRSGDGLAMALGFAVRRWSSDRPRR